MTSTPPSQDVHEAEAELRTLIDAGNVDRATERAIRVYGSEVSGWLSSIFPNEADAQDAFSRMSEELWRSFKRFDGRCSIRTWCYMLARHAASHVRSWPRNGSEVLFAHIPSVLGAVTHVWNTTRRGEHHALNVYAEIRRQLGDEDQTLLVLRVDRNLTWRDIAIVVLGEGAHSDEVMKKASALRKQFERVKQRLRELAAKRLQD